MLNRDNFRRHKPWQQNRFYSTAYRNLWLTLLALGLCAGGSALLLNELNSRLGGDWTRFNAGSVIFVLLPMLAAIIAIDVVRQLRGLRRYGRIAMTMDPYPGCIGGQVGGCLTLAGLPAGARVQVLLSCMYVYTSRLRSESRRTERVVWCEEGIAGSHAMGHKTQLTFAFDVPPGLPESAEPKGDYHYWQVTLEADVPGVDLKRSYRIPVFSGRQRARGVVESTSARAADRRRADAQVAIKALDDGALAAAGLGRAVRYRRDGDSESFYYPMGRQWLVAVFGAVFALAFGWAVTAIVAMGSPSWAGVLFAVLFASPFALVALAGAVLAFYFAFSSLWVSVSLQGIITKRCLFGLSVIKRMVPAAGVRTIRVQQTSSVSRGGRVSAYYSLYLVSRYHPELKIGEDIKGRELADALAAYLCRRLGVEDAASEDVATAQSTLPQGVVDLLQRGHRVAAASSLKKSRPQPLKQARREIDKFLRDNPQLARQPPDGISRLMQQVEPYLPLLKFVATVYPCLIALGFLGMMATQFF